MKTVMRFRALDLLEALACFKDQIDLVVEANQNSVKEAQQTDTPDVLRPAYPAWALEEATVTNEDGWVTIKIGPATSVSFSDADRIRRQVQATDDYMAGARRSDQLWEEALKTACRP